MVRPLLTALVSFLLASAFASSSSSNANPLKRKDIEVLTENVAKVARISGEADNTGSKKYIPTPYTGPTSEYITKGNVDLHPPSLPQRGDNLQAYEALFCAICRRDFETTFIILSVFPQLKLTRYVHKINADLYMNCYHLALMYFSAEDFKTFVSFGHEADLVYPYSLGANLLDAAIKSKDQGKIDFLTRALAPHMEKAKQLKEQVRARGIIYLFIKEEL